MISIPDLRPVRPFSHPSAGVSSALLPNLLSMHPKSREKHKNKLACDECDHPIKTDTNMRKHKRVAHGNVVFKCLQPGCEYSSPWKGNVASHLKGFHGTVKSFACDHPGCSFESSWRDSIAKHERYVHSDDRPFACDHPVCSFRFKTRSNLTNHKTLVHLNIRTKQCHVCDKRFSWKAALRVHMMAQHQTKDHDMAKCDHCVTYLKKNHRMSLSAIASFKRRNERKGSHSTPRDACRADQKGQEKLSDSQQRKRKEAQRRAQKQRSGPSGKHANGDVSSESIDHCLNDDLVNVHIHMQLLSSA